MIALRLAGAMIVVFYFKQGLAAVWVVLAGELFLRGVMAWVRFEQGGWKHLEV